MNDPEIKKVHEDKRGIIYTFFVDEKERLLIFTKKDYMRAGHTHKEVQHTMVLSGCIKWTEWRNDHEEMFYLNEGNKQITPSFVPHLMEALSECWILETKVDNDNYISRVLTKHYRKLVEKGMK